ncbi:minor capsid protein [Pedobacter sp. MW01-1-1]|uniref:minor capsid protein n=1 Tax=Pedobacter sp. MW01-1-1 TaxID=3383027 RepID=UPI003FEEC7E1
MCIQCHSINLSVNLDGLEPEFRRVAKLIYEGKLKAGQIDQAMTKKIAEQFMQSFWQGYGDGTAMPDSFIKHIEQNVWVFSGFKNHSQLTEARSLLLSENGSYKSFNTWFQDIKKINDTYNETYAAAEHANVLACSQSISSWNDFKAHNIQRLRFETAGDNRVRADHAVLEGTVVSIDDPLLNEYYTPLDWGCRCEWVPAVDEELTGWSDLPDIPPMFQTNVAKTGVIFPDTHPYFNVSKSAAKSVLEQVTSFINETTQTENVVINTFNLYTGKHGGYVKAVNNVRKNDISINIDTAKILADNGHKVTLLETGNVEGVKYPDAEIGKKPFEFKVNSTPTKSAIDNLLRKGGSQADNIAIRINSSISINDFSDAVENRLNRKPNVKALWVIWNNRLIKLSRKQFLNKVLIKKAIMKNITA